MTRLIILGSSAEFPFPRTETNKFKDYSDISGYPRRFKLHDDPLCRSARKGGKDRRTRASLALITKRGTIIFDVGPDIRYQLDKYRVRPDVVFITHEHPDANYGLRYLPKRIPIFGGKQGNIKYDELVEILGAKILPFKVPHSRIAPFTGYRIKIAGKSFAYVTDMSSATGLKKYLKGCNILFADGSILKRNLGGHLSIENQLKIYKKWRLKKVIFTHIGHATLRHEDLVKYVKGRYQNSDVAYDGLVIELKEIINEKRKL